MEGDKDKSGDENGRCESESLKDTENGSDDSKIENVEIYDSLELENDGRRTRRRRRSCKGEDERQDSENRKESQNERQNMECDLNRNESDTDERNDENGVNRSDCIEERNHGEREDMNSEKSGGELDVELSKEEKKTDALHREPTVDIIGPLEVVEFEDSDHIEMIQVTESRRVKLYILNARGEWTDRGTGHASCLQLSEVLYGNGPHGLMTLALRVVSEETQEILFFSRVRRIQDAAYQIQNGTILSWTEHQESHTGSLSLEMALSFSDEIGCQEIWQEICRANQVLTQNTSQLASNRNSTSHSIAQSRNSLQNHRGNGTISALYSLESEVVERSTWVDDEIDFGIYRSDDQHHLEISDSILDHHLNQFSNANIDSNPTSNRNELNHHSNLKLPCPNRQTLDEIVSILNESKSPLGSRVVVERMYEQWTNERVACEVLRDEFVLKLIETFDECEKECDRNGLELCFKVVSGLFLLGNTNVVQVLVKSEFWMGILGALEYDSDVFDNTTQHITIPIRRHRQFIQSEAQYQEIIPLKSDLVIEKIHQNYRLTYVKDMILSRVLDDATFTAMSTLMFYNNMDIVAYFVNEKSITYELFGYFEEIMTKMKENSVETNKKVILKQILDWLRFMIELCSLARPMQATSKTQFYRVLEECGIFSSLKNTLQCDDSQVQILSMELLACIFSHDPIHARNVICDVQNHAHVVLNLVLEKLNGLYCAEIAFPASEIIRLLLESESASGSNEKEHFLITFYSTFATQLLSIFEISPENCIQQHSTCSLDNPYEVACSQVCDLLCLCISQHGNHSKQFILRFDILSKVIHLSQHSAAHLRLCFIQFIRSFLCLKDEFYSKLITENQVLERISQMYRINCEKNNLLMSSILDLLEVIKRNSMKDIAKVLIDQYSTVFDHDSSRNVFHELVKLCKDDTEGGVEQGEQHGVEIKDVINGRIEAQRDEVEVERNAEDAYFENLDEDIGEKTTKNVEIGEETSDLKVKSGMTELQVDLKQVEKSGDEEMKQSLMPRPLQNGVVKKNVELSAQSDDILSKNSRVHGHGESILDGYDSSEGSESEEHHVDSSVNSNGIRKRNIVDDFSTETNPEKRTKSMIQWERNEFIHSDGIPHEIVITQDESHPSTPT